MTDSRIDSRSTRHSAAQSYPLPAASHIWMHPRCASHADMRSDSRPALTIDAFKFVDRLIVTQLQALLDRRAPDRPEEGFPRILRITVGLKLKAAPPPQQLAWFVSVPWPLQRRVPDLSATISPFLCFCFCFCFVGLSRMCCLSA